MDRYNSNSSDKEYFLDRFKWITFFIERFDPLSHLVMIGLFIIGHVAMVESFTTIKVVLAFVGTTVFFFKLRCFDEVKDLDLDLKINPTRPLPRGLLSVFDMKDSILLCILVENIIFYSISTFAGVSMSLASLYSIIMYKEFFLGDWFRDKLTSYATAHTLVTILLSLSIFCALEGKSILELNTNAYAFSLMSWLLFNIFELGRKTFLGNEERDQVESYSKVWGKRGAVVLVLTHVVIVDVILSTIINQSKLFSQVYFKLSLILFVLAGCFFLIRKDGKAGAVFRGYSSFYIILIYLGIFIQKIL